MEYLVNSYVAVVVILSLLVYLAMSVVVLMREIGKPRRAFPPMVIDLQLYRSIRSERGGVR